ncbi:MAG TPA: hypothetical protein VIY29_04755 [Ktedonobacteraceae bacterium]
MKGQTKNLTRQVRDALLALPDTVLMETLTWWLDGVYEQLLDWSDECRYALGYCIQSDETDKIYASFEELGQAEPEGVGGSWMVPDAQTLRTILGNLSLEQFYHTVIALALQASEEVWGFSPSVASDGYDFMRSLTVHLRYQALRRPEQGHIYFPQQTTGRRKPMLPSSSGLPGWRLRSSRHRESTSSPDASTAAPLATRGTTSTGGLRQSVSPRDWSADMIQ